MRKATETEGKGASKTLGSVGEERETEHQRKCTQRSSDRREGNIGTTAGSNSELVFQKSGKYVGEDRKRG